MDKIWISSPGSKDTFFPYTEYLSKQQTTHCWIDHSHIHICLHLSQLLQHSLYIKWFCQSKKSYKRCTFGRCVRNRIYTTLMNNSDHINEKPIFSDIFYPLVLYNLPWKLHVAQVSTLKSVTIVTSYYILRLCSVLATIHQYSTSST